MLPQGEEQNNNKSITAGTTTNQEHQIANEIASQQKEHNRNEDNIRRTTQYVRF